MENATTQRALRLFGITGALVVLLAMLNPYSYPLDFRLSNLNNNFFANSEYYVQQYILKRTSRDGLERAADGIRHAVPPHTVVSSVEAGMPLLYRNRSVELFPADIDNADYAVLGALFVDGKIRYGGAVSYLGPNENAKLNALVLARMKRDGYDLEHPARFPGYNGLAVVRRVH